MDRFFQFLFKYPSFVFDQGDFAFSASRTMTVLIVVAAVAALGALVTYRGIQGEQTARDRIILTTLRTALVALLAFCLFRPSLVLKAAVPQQNFLGILLDDSRSMTIADTGRPDRGPSSCRISSASRPVRCSTRFRRNSSSASSASRTQSTA